MKRDLPRWNFIPISVFLLYKLYENHKALRDFVEGFLPQLVGGFMSAAKNCVH